MKKTIHIYVTNAEEVVQGKEPHIHADTMGGLTITGWVAVGKTEIEVNYDVNDLREAAFSVIGEETQKLRAELYALDIRRKNMLAIEHKGEK